MIAKEKKNNAYVTLQLLVVNMEDRAKDVFLPGKNKDEVCFAAYDFYFLHLVHY
jgi:hypothetical protein